MKKAKAPEDIASDLHRQFPKKQAEPEISFPAMIGFSHPHTMHVIGVLRKTNITILLDSGSTHNFIDPYLVSKLRLLIVKDNHFQVTVANVTKLNYDGVCLGLSQFKVYRLKQFFYSTTWWM